MFIVFIPFLCLQLFRERLSYILGTAHVTESKVIMGNGGSYGCLSELQGVSAWWTVTADTRVFMLSISLLINHRSLNQAKPNA